MKKIYITVSVLLVFGLVLTACATPPTEEMNKAHDAVTQAENDADAVTYAGNTLIRARDALTRMQNEVDAKRYDTAKNLATEAINLAEKAIADGKNAAARAKNDAENIYKSLGTPLAETAYALDNAKQADNLELDLNTLSDDMDTAHQTYDEAGQSLEAENYQDSVIKSQNVRSILADINSDITNAAVEASRKQ